MSDLGTDRGHLQRVAYGTSALLADRAALYKARMPPLDIAAWVVDQLPSASRGGLVIDVGCGPGVYLRAVGGPAVGIDLSHGMALEASAVAPAIVADAQRLPIADGVADVVMMLHMLYHAPDPGLALAEARRVVRPGGVVAVLTNRRGHLGSMRALFASAVGEGGTSLGAGLEARFDDITAPAYLSSVFSTVKTSHLDGVVRLTRPEPALAHLATARALHPAFDDASWASVLTEVRSQIEAAIRRDGWWETASANAFYLCVP